MNLYYAAMNKNKNKGSDFDSFLKKEGLLQERAKIAKDRVALLFNRATTNNALSDSEKGNGKRFDSVDQLMKDLTDEEQ